MTRWSPSENSTPLKISRLQAGQRMRQSLADVTNLVNREQSKLISLRLRNDVLKVQSAPQHKNSLALGRTQALPDQSHCIHPSTRLNAHASDSAGRESDLQGKDEEARGAVKAQTGGEQAQGKPSENARPRPDCPSGSQKGGREFIRRLQQAPAPTLRRHPPAHILFVRMIKRHY